VTKIADKKGKEEIQSSYIIKADHITGTRQQAQQLKDKTKKALAKASEEIEGILLR